MSKAHNFSNKEISLILKEVLAAMEVKNVSFFRIRAYQTVISAIEGLSVSVQNLWENNKLDSIPGVGPTIISHLDELFTTGDVKEFERAKEDLPEGMFELIGIRGIGAKKAFKLATAFSLTKRSDAISKLKKAAEAGQIRVLEGFAEKSEKLILDALSENKLTKNEKQRTLYFKAEQVVERISDYLKQADFIDKFEVVGSFRRKQPTVGDIEFAISCDSPEKATEYFLKYPEIEEVLVSGKTRSSVVINNDLQVDIRVFEPKVWGSMLQYFTGSKSHNIALRTYSLENGLSLSEYGIKDVKTGEVHEFDKEEAFYKFLNLDYIPPEIRQGKNEVALAKAHKLPKLINLSDIKGDLHTHTTFSDGANTLEEMVSAAKELGYSYIGISDHAPSVESRGYKEVEKIISETKEKIRKINEKETNFRVFYGYEVNILTNATLSLPDELLKELDYVIASIHTNYKQSREEITHRFVKALENEYVTFIGHPSGRLLNERSPYEVEWREFFAAVSYNNKMIEINGQPNRLDLPEDLISDALEKNIPLVLSSDAHSTEQLSFMRYATYTARRGLCEKKDIFNVQVEPKFNLS